MNYYFFGKIFGFSAFVLAGTLSFAVGPAAASEDDLLGVTPPKYLSIKGYRACAGTKEDGFMQSVCLPGNRPENCDEDIWKQLQSLRETDALPKCKLSATAPKYLAIEGYKACTGLKQTGSSSMVCLPAVKPEHCDQRAWDKLEDLKEKDQMKSC